MGSAPGLSPAQCPGQATLPSPMKTGRSWAEGDAAVPVTVLLRVACFLEVGGGGELHVTDAEVPALVLLGPEPWEIDSCPLSKRLDNVAMSRRSTQWC